MLAPPEVELMNLWRDFLKVTSYIDVNKAWLEPLLERVKNSRG